MLERLWRILLWRFHVPLATRKWKLSGSSQLFYHSASFSLQDQPGNKLTMASDAIATATETGAPKPIKQPTKSILRKPKRPGSKPEPAAASPTRDDAAVRATALKHANIIQSRKDAAEIVTDNILELLDLPTKPPLSPPQPAASPSPSDTSSFLRLISPFTPTDYDDLIAERNVYDQCGYALCPLQRRKFKGTGKWKLEAGGVALRADVEKWCSTQCARRALYVRVQLGETQPWERTGGELELLDESQGKHARTATNDGGKGAGDNTREKSKNAVAAEAQLAKEMEDLKLRDDIKAGKRAQVLALERGENDASKSSGLASVDIKEKTVMMAPTEPSLDPTSKEGEIEGYKSKFG